MSFKGKKKSNVYAAADGYNLYAENYDKTLGYLDSFEGEVIFKMLANLKVERAMDLGCGTGRLTEALGGCAKEVAAVDISPEMLKITKEKFPKIQTVLAEAGSLPFENDSFDLVLASFLIVHLKDLEVVFDEVYRVLKDGGIFIITNINQRKAPKLELKNREKIVINSFYHRPIDVLTALESSLFKIEKEEFVYGKGVWINQIIKAKK